MKIAKLQKKRKKKNSILRDQYNWGEKKLYNKPEVGYNRRYDDQ